LHEEEVIAVK
jgi:hypothetical protein